jgi:hypothetical protein
MPKEIRCNCGTLVAVLEKGSKWNPGSTAICPKCTEESKKKKLTDNLKNMADQYNQKNNDYGSSMADLFGGFNR